MKNPVLEVLICTYGKRIYGLPERRLPQVPGVVYTVSVQNPEHLDLSAVISTLEERADISVHENYGKGLSNNRNVLFELAKAPYILIADDDIDYCAEGLDKLVETFLKNPDIDLVTVRVNTEEPHVYPTDGHPLDRPVKFYSPISFEIAVKRSFLIYSGVRFSPKAGVNAPFLECGEEEFFLHKLRKSGARGIFRNILLGTHDGPTTCAHSALRPGVLAAKGALLQVIYGPLESLLRFPLEAHRSQAPWLKAMYYYLRGYIYSIKYRKEL